MRRGYRWWFAVVTLATLAGAVAVTLVGAALYAVGATTWLVIAAAIIAGLAVEAFLFDKADQDGEFSR